MHEGMIDPGIIRTNFHRRKRIFLSKDILVADSSVIELQIR